MVPPHDVALVGQLPDLLRLATVQPPRQTAGDIIVGATFELVFSAVILSLIGAVVMAIAPDFTADGVEYVHEHPGEAFVYGVIAYVALIAATILLAITIVGLLVVIPGLIVVAILGLGATTVAIVSLGAWLQSALDGRPVPASGTGLVVGAVTWATIDLVPVLGGLVTFVLSAMGFGYLSLYLVNGRSDRYYGSLDEASAETDDRSAYDRYDPHRERDEKRDDGSDGGTRDDEESDRFRNVAAIDAEREDADSRRDEDGPRDR
ncbi:hypothetical protein [Halorubrum sp. DTA98]|uniref:hypothetical protein n=1 Tax=Halorubrum sp. DTA98 TaxID=3402163 RepID=UPI003AAC8115